MIAHKENMSNEESNALLVLRGYHSDEDEKPTGHPTVNLQLFCNTFLLLVLIHPICIQYKVQKYSELEESMKAELDFFMPKNFEKNQFMYQRKAVASKANGKLFAGYIYVFIQINHFSFLTPF